MEGETAAGEHLSLREFADDNQESAVGSTEASEGKTNTSVGAGKVFLQFKSRSGDHEDKGAEPTLFDVNKQLTTQPSPAHPRSCPPSHPTASVFHASYFHGPLSHSLLCSPTRPCSRYLHLL